MHVRKLANWQMPHRLIVIRKRWWIVMTQQLNVSIAIPIPEDMVLIKRVEFEELQREQLNGVYWTMKDLEKRLNKKHEWIKENILYPTKFRKVLDVKNGGPVYYPEVNGEKWAFHATKTAQFLEDNFYSIFGSQYE